jgi:hypothetical protein
VLLTMIPWVCFSFYDHFISFVGTRKFKSLKCSFEKQA